MTIERRSRSLFDEKREEDQQFLRGLAKIHPKPDRHFQDLARLKKMIVEADELYRRELSIAESNRRDSTLYRAKVPLQRLISLLERPENVADVGRALGGVRSGAMQREALLHQLRRISTYLPEQRAKSLGPPRKGPALHTLVLFLARFWESELGIPFKQEWFTEDGENRPISPGARFVEAIVTRIGLKEAASLRQVTVNVATQLRRADKHRKSQLDIRLDE